MVDQLEITFLTKKRQKLFIKTFALLYYMIVLFCFMQIESSNC